MLVAGSIKAKGPISSAALAFFVVCGAFSYLFGLTQINVAILFGLIAAVIVGVLYWGINRWLFPGRNSIDNSNLP
jgi:hypothetical protein